MAVIGVKHQVLAPITTITDGSPVTYGAGQVVTGGSGLASVNVSWSYGDQSLYLDDKLAESDRPLTGGTDDNPPLVGYGYIRSIVMAGVRKYEAVWLYKVQFTQPSDNATTRGEQVNYETTGLEGKIMGVVVDTTGKVRYSATKTCTTEAEAVTWLKAKANIT